MDFLRGKWQLWFNVLDVNRDGSLSHDDTVITVDTFASLHNLDAAAAKTVGEKIDNWWKDYILQGRTEAIAKEHFLATLGDQYAADKSKYISHLNVVFFKGFSIIDINNDGNISEDEFTVMFKALGHTDETMSRTIFKSMNPKDGLVSIQVITDAWVDFITNDDSSKPCPIKSALEAEKR